jgi:aminopeptidase N
MWRILLLATILICPYGGHAQLVTSSAEGYSYADQLRGGQRKERWCYDVTHYDLQLRIDTTTKSISGSNTISYTALEDFNTVQIDLFANMNVLRITSNGNELKYRREYDAVFVEFPQTVTKGTKSSFKVEYKGSPRIAKNPPWDGGFTWTHDKKGNRWIAVSCQGIGASLWWPNKDDLSDEPDSMRISCAVPNPLRCVANGQELPSTQDEPDYTTYHWKVSYPINNYNVSINIADYAHWSEVYTAEDGDKLDLDYYVLSYNLDKSKKHFQQVKPMLACFEKYLGKYPFWKDGYALVETPYLGMEHQGAVAYGNNYKSGYAGMDMSGSGLKFDYLIIHETGHEWWGNSVTAKDLADMWIHESFCTYSEAIYVECLHGYDTAMTYVNALKRNVGNKKPIMGTYGINKEGDGDMYVKGMLFLNTIRHVVNNDDLWWSTIKNMSDTTFKIRNTNYKEVVQVMSEKTGMNLAPIFEQYVKWPAIPVLQYKVKKKGKEYCIKYRWKVNAKKFEMPVVFLHGDKEYRVSGSTKWKKTRIWSAIEQGKPTIDMRRFYVHAVGVK